MTLTWNTQAPAKTALDALERFQWSVIPLGADKKPLFPWKEYQTRRATPDEIIAWQKRYKNPLAWAVITGAISNLVILDFDGTQGEETRNKLELNPHVRTGSGGSHVDFQYPGWLVKTLNSKSKIELGRRWPGLDIRADGGYAAFIGHNLKGPYEWLREFEPERLDILPEALRSFLGLLHSPEHRNTHKSQYNQADAILKWALERIGNVGRNDGGFDLACQLRDNGFSELQAESVMREYVQRVGAHNTKGQFEPYTDTEALASLKSAYSAPAREPWEPSTSEQVSSHSDHGNGNSASHGSASAEVVAEKSTRPWIILGGQDREARDAALAALHRANRDNPFLFVQAASLSNIGRDKKGNPIIQTVAVHEMKNALTDCADFVKIKENKLTGEKTPVDVPVPQAIAEYILSLSPHRWPFKPLDAIVETPILRPDGSILDTPGYDEATQLYYAPSEDMKRCKVPLNPNNEDVTAAKNLIFDAIGQFPYESESDFANTVGTLLTPIVRPIVKGDVQAALFDATKPGTGKGLLTDFISITATGNKATPIKLADTDEELEKRIVSKLRGGTTMMVIDNITRKITSAILELALTRRAFEGRLLGQSKMIQVINRATWIATGNNIQLGGDLARRCYRIRLVSPVSNPDERDDFKIPDLTSWIEENRPEVVSALLTMARAWFVAGKPKAQHVPNLASFTDWAKTVGGILEYAGIQGFQGNRAELKADANVEEGQWEMFLLAWEKNGGNVAQPIDKLASKIKAAADNSAGSLAGSSDQLPATDLYDALPESLKIALQEKPSSFNMKLSKSLEKRIKTPYGIHNIRVEPERDKHTKQNLWRVVRVGAGSYSPPSRDEKNGEFSQTRKDIVTGGMIRETTRTYPQNGKNEPVEPIQLAGSVNGLPAEKHSPQPSSKQHPLPQESQEKSVGSISALPSSNGHSSHLTPQTCPYSLTIAEDAHPLTVEKYKNHRRVITAWGDGWVVRIGKDTVGVWLDGMLSSQEMKFFQAVPVKGEES